MLPPGGFVTKHGYFLRLFQICLPLVFLSAPRLCLAEEVPSARGEPLLSVLVFPVVLDGVELSPKALGSFQGFFSSRLATEGVYSVVSASSVKQAVETDASYDNCRDRTCMIQIARSVGADAFVSLSISGGDGQCVLKAVLREVATGATRSAGKASGGCKAVELSQTAMFVAAQISGQIDQEIVDEDVVVSEESAGDSEPVKPEADKKEKEPPREIRWIAIPGGNVPIGESCGLSSGLATAQVTVRPMEITETEITVAQYRSCVEDGACTPAHFDDKSCYFWSGGKWKSGILPKAFRGDNHPVVCVDLDQAQAFASWAGGRLPTEAEWLQAALCGRQSDWPWGADKPTCAKAVMDHHGKGCKRETSWQVCSRPEGNTPEGLCDMAGNVWELVRATAVSTGSNSQVIRGGSWRSNSSEISIGYRGCMAGGYRDGDVGFRIVRDLENQK